MRILIFCSLFCLFSSTCFTQDTEYDKMLSEMYENTVDLIQPEELIELQKNGIKVHLLDTREKKEFNISHIKSAKLAGFYGFKLNRFSSIPKDEVVIVYCSVGYRSERIGEKLKEAGYTKVYNLYGGIFLWANKENELIDKKGNKTTKVHGYSSDWGKWVEKGEVTY